MNPPQQQPPLPDESSTLSASAFTAFSAQLASCSPQREQLSPTPTATSVPPEHVSYLGQVDSKHVGGYPHHPLHSIPSPPQGQLLFQQQQQQLQRQYVLQRQQLQAHFRIQQLQLQQQQQSKYQPDPESQSQSQGQMLDQSTDLLNNNPRTNITADMPVSSSFSSLATSTSYASPLPPPLAQQEASFALAVHLPRQQQQQSQQQHHQQQHQVFQQYPPQLQQLHQLEQLEQLQHLQQQQQQQQLPLLLAHPHSTQLIVHPLAVQPSNHLSYHPDTVAHINTPKAFVSGPPGHSSLPVNAVTSASSSSSTLFATTALSDTPSSLATSMGVLAMPPFSLHEQQSFNPFHYQRQPTPDEQQQQMQASAPRSIGSPLLNMSSSLQLVQQVPISSTSPSISTAGSAPVISGYPNLDMHLSHSQAPSGFDGQDMDLSLSSSSTASSTTGPDGLSRFNSRTNSASFHQMEGMMDTTHFGNLFTAKRSSVSLLLPGRHEGRRLSKESDSELIQQLSRTSMENEAIPRVSISTSASNTVPAPSSASALFVDE
ncbi:hypothetical protein BG004_007203, partial [Podila humilis]